jgi:hypothetical protein
MSTTTSTTTCELELVPVLAAFQTAKQARLTRWLTGKDWQSRKALKKQITATEGVNRLVLEGLPGDAEEGRELITAEFIEQMTAAGSLETLERAGHLKVRLKSVAVFPAQEGASPPPARCG